MDDILSQIKKNDLNGLLQKIEVSGTYVVGTYLWLLISNFLITN